MMLASLAPSIAAFNHRGFSPGVASHALAAAHNAAQGERLYDFMAGANQLKESFATKRYRLVWQVLQRPRLDHRLRAAARRIKQVRQIRGASAPRSWVRAR